METIHELHDYFPHHGNGGHANVAGGHHVDDGHRNTDIDVIQPSRQPDHDHGRHKRGSVTDNHENEHSGYGFMGRV
jgi:hypothetical protein